MNSPATIELSAEIADAAGHIERKALSLPLLVDRLRLAAFPEMAELVPHVENRVYVVTTEPDGQPISCDIMANGRTYKTDAQGLCMVPFIPLEKEWRLAISARDARGRSAETTLVAQGPGSSPPAKMGADQGEKPKAPDLLLRPDKAVYLPGEKPQLTLLSIDETKTAYVDVMRDRQMISTQVARLTEGRDELSLELPREVSGFLKVYGYTVDSHGRRQGGARWIYVNPASDLQISAAPDREVYGPGETAKLAFTVTDRAGHPAPSALGINIVDESVFALAASPEGFAQQSFNAAQRALSPLLSTRLFASPLRLLRTAEGHPLAAEAYLASLHAESQGSSLDDYLSSGLIDHLRLLQGTPAYERFRGDARWAEAYRLLENPEDDYSLTVATGRLKVWAAERHRERYLDGLGDLARTLFFGGLLFLPAALLIYGVQSPTLPEGTVFLRPAKELLRVTSQQHRLLSLLTIAPYPYYAVVFGLSIASWIPWAAFLLELLTVITCCGAMFTKVDPLETLGLKEEATNLRQVVALYIGQFVGGRLAICAVSARPQWEEFIGLYLLVILMPWLALAASRIVSTRLLLKHGVPKSSIPPLNLLAVLGLIIGILIFGGIAMPVFSTVQVRGQATQVLSDLAQIERAEEQAALDAADAPKPAAPPRLRTDFPETLLWQPELITDDQGRATLEVPLADSITTWRASLDAVARSGQLANAELPIRAFQDFFVELDLPESLTLGDSISVPAVCHNYLDTPLEVQLSLGDADWFEASEENRRRTVKLAAHEVRRVDFPITVTRAGQRRLRVTAQAGATGDAMEREVRVVPSGKRVERTENELLRDSATFAFDLPAEAIAGASSLTVAIYPSRFSEVVAGLDSIFEAPHGCFEQTSSTTYPNVLVLEYLKSTGQIAPKLEHDARAYISAGYQRLLTFEAPGGGFSLFGGSPASLWLTAYGLLEFNDMQKVQPVDAAMLQRTFSWLYAQQAADGSWNDDYRLKSLGESRSATIYIAWALAEAGVQPPQLEKALGFLRQNRANLKSTYYRALAANALLAYDRNDAIGRSLTEELANAAEFPQHDCARWTSQGPSLSYSSGESLAVETTSLVALALIKDGRWPELTRQALTWISRQKYARGGWCTTQATILAMRALLAGGATSVGAAKDSDIAVLLNGAEIQTLHITKEHRNVMQFVSFTDRLKTGGNRVELRLKPAGELPYQIHGAYWLPAAKGESGDTDSPLQIDVAYERTNPVVGELLKCSVTAQNQTHEDIQTPMVILSVPPGFDLETEAFDALKSAGRIALYEIKGDQVVLYLQELRAAAPLKFDYFLRAKYPLQVTAPAAIVYEYYTPEIRAASRVQTLTVATRP